MRLHTNFAHHRDGVLRLLGLPHGAQTERAAVAAALAGRTPQASKARRPPPGLVVAAARQLRRRGTATRSTGRIARAPLVEIVRIGDAARAPWPALRAGALPLDGLRVLDLTRILAGPVAARTLAAYGADVMLVNSPHLPNIEAIADTSRGKRSALADLRDRPTAPPSRLRSRQAHVFCRAIGRVALAGLGFGAEDAARARPGIVYVSLSAYATPAVGERRGFDSLVQTATGLNDDEADAAGSRGPKPLPVQVLDMARASCSRSAARRRCCASSARAAAGTCACRWRAPRSGCARSAASTSGFAVAEPDVASRMEASDPASAGSPRCAMPRASRRSAGASFAAVDAARAAIRCAGLSAGARARRRRCMRSA